MEKIRTWLKPETRGTVYTVAAAVVAALVVFGILSSTMAGAIAGVVVAGITLLYAIIHSESNLRTAFYALCVAVGAFFVTLGSITGDEADALLAIIAPVAGITLAAAKAPAKSEEERPVGWVEAK